MRTDRPPRPPKTGPNTLTTPTAGSHDRWIENYVRPLVVAESEDDAEQEDIESLSYPADRGRNERALLA